MNEQKDFPRYYISGIDHMGFDGPPQGSWLEGCCFVKEGPGQYRVDYTIGWSQGIHNGGVSLDFMLPSEWLQRGDWDYFMMQAFSSSGGVIASISRLLEGQEGLPDFLELKKGATQDVDWSLQDGTITISGTGFLRSWTQWTRQPDHVEEISTAVIKSGITEIGVGVFKGFTGLRHVELPEGLTVISQSLFNGCDSIRSLRIPKTAVGIDKSVLQRYSVQIDPENSAYMAIDGCVYLRKTKQLIVCSRDKTQVIIQEGTPAIGEYAFWMCKELRTIVIPESVSRIGKCAFIWCEKLQSITLPAAVSSIGESAFSFCTSLTGIALPAGLKAIPEGMFSGCRSLTEITIPEGVQIIENQAFFACSALRKVNLPKSLKQIWSGAFMKCPLLKDIDFPEGLQKIEPQLELKAARHDVDWSIQDGTITISGTGVLRCWKQWTRQPDHVEEINTAVIKSGITEIGAGVFKGFTGLRHVELPEGLTVIRQNSFRAIMCNGIQSIRIPKTAVNIDKSVLQGYSVQIDPENPAFMAIDGCVYQRDTKQLISCSREKSQVIIQEGTLAIGEHAFDWRKELRTVVIPESVSRIGDSAFSYCDKLQSITLPAAVSFIGKSAFSFCTSLTGIALPAGLKAIPEGMFSGCSSLTEITIPEGVQIIEKQAFDGCSALRKVNLPESLKQIRSGAFMNCSLLKDIDFPEGLSLIEYQAFKNCPGVKRVSLRSGRVDDLAFDGCASTDSTVSPKEPKKVQNTSKPSFTPSASSSTGSQHNNTAPCSNTAHHAAAEACAGTQKTISSAKQKTVQNTVKPSSTTSTSSSAGSQPNKNTPCSSTSHQTGAETDVLSSLIKKAGSFLEKILKGRKGS